MCSRAGGPFAAGRQDAQGGRLQKSQPVPAGRQHLAVRDHEARILPAATPPHAFAEKVPEVAFGRWRRHADHDRADDQRPEQWSVAGLINADDQYSLAGTRLSGRCRRGRRANSIRSCERAGHRSDSNSGSDTGNNPMGMIHATGQADTIDTAAVLLQNEALGFYHVFAFCA